MNQYISRYHNEEYGFEIDLPDGWFIPSGFSRLPVILANSINDANILVDFSNKDQENLNIVVEKMLPEIPPDLSQLIFTVQARKMNYSDVNFKTITIGGRLHTCVTYIMNLRGFLKKYLIVLNGYGYALTASCPINNRSTLVEETWDTIATSFRLLKPIDTSIIEFNDSPQSRRLLENLRNEYLKLFLQ